MFVEGFLRIILCAALAIALTTASAIAQVLPSQPITMLGGRVVVGGEVSASIASSADRGYFNYTDYEHNALRLVRLGVTGAVRLGSRASVLTEIRTENLDTIRPYALYLRIRPWLDRPIDIQAGLIPPIFGAFMRRSYGPDRPLIGYPLAYQYLTSLRPDATPATVRDLLRNRGAGWHTYYSVGSKAGDQGVPLVTGFRWDTGVEVRIGSRPVEVSAALTTGTLSNPRVRDDNSGKQASAHLTIQPTTGLILGLSTARGAFLARRVTSSLPVSLRDAGYNQYAFGADMEYSRDHWLVRAEGIWSFWRIPLPLDRAHADPLRASAVSIEGRYKVGPPLYIAGRFDRLGFSTISDGIRRLSWEIPVTRLELGGGYYLQRNIIGKLVYQWNWRHTQYEPFAGYAAAQLVYWF
ncbi:MAG: hypothetical protein HYX76_02650 [Acidobacteria bacterium]|nr:hypothetical protein [Acidobacteriota bacterium]